MKKFNRNLMLGLAAALTLGLAWWAIAASAVNLGTADSFAVLAGSTITNTGPSVVNGNLGLSPGTAVSGFPPGTLNGTQQIANAVAVQAKADLVTAYNNAAGQTPVFTVPTELGGTTKTAGVYNSADGTFGITGTLTLNAQGNPNAVFIFKAASSLITAGSSHVNLINDAQACNVFWQVGSSATLGTNSTFKGNILALASITLTTGAQVEGRVLARNGAVTLDTNTITKAICADTPPTPTSTTPTSTTPTSTTPTSTPPISTSTPPGDTAQIGTNLTRDTSGGIAPIVKAKWEANLDRYTDESDSVGAQFTASGQYQVNKTISICSVVTDPDGLADIDAVYADVFYPTNIALGSSNVNLPGQSGDGCGKLMQEDKLTKLDKQTGINLFCNQVKNLNNNLPTFNPDYNYDEICAADGELQKETAAVFCGAKDLSYEDPAGDYEVWAVAQDKVGLQGTLVNHFTYLPTTAFEADFTSVFYGNVRLNTHKIIPGDLTWDPSSSPRPTVRNTGNTRLTMNVWQDDMGFGKTDGLWNVKFDARVGSDAASVSYWPNTLTTLADSLDLSELNEMDFSIDVSKFPPTHIFSSYTGQIVLTGTTAPQRNCSGGFVQN